MGLFSEAKKGIWGWKGFCIICLSLIQLGINRYYIDANLQIYGCYANLTRYFLTDGDSTSM
jgi:hypothetical protein